MLVELLVLFIIIVVAMLILSAFMMESDKPEIAIPFVMVGLIFSVLCSYGFWNIQWFYIKFENTTNGNITYTPAIYSTMQFGNPYSYIFMVLFFIFCILFVRIGWNVVNKAAETKGMLDFKKMRY